MTEAKTEDRTAKKAKLKEARIKYNDLRKFFGAPPIDFPEIS